MDSSDESKKNFIKYIFNFNDNTKAELLNIIQYGMLSLIPLISLNKLIAKYIPDADDNKGTIEIIAEIIIQVLVMLLGFFYVDRIINFFPTYSGEEYPKNHVIYMTLAFLMITFSIHSRLGEKMNILIDRILELWEGPSSQNKPKDKSKVKVSQPISGKLPPTMPPAHTRNVALSNSFSDGTSIHSLPTSDMTQANNQNTMASQQLPDYNKFHEKDDTPLVNAASPAEGFDGPVAANSVMGGGFGTAW